MNDKNLPLVDSDTSVENFEAATNFVQDLIEKGFSLEDILSLINDAHNTLAE